MEFVQAIKSGVGKGGGSELSLTISGLNEVTIFSNSFCIVVGKEFTS